MAVEIVAVMSGSLLSVAILDKWTRAKLAVTFGGAEIMAVGIIAEFNPFHDGHAFQIAEIRRKIPGAEIVAVMSGSFTQCGDS